MVLARVLFGKCTLPLLSVLNFRGVIVKAFYLWPADFHDRTAVQQHVELRNTRQVFDACHLHRVEVVLPQCLVCIICLVF